MKWGSIFLVTGGIIGSVLVENAHALRPFRAATDAAVVDPGKVEVELGFDVSRNTRGDNDETSYALPSVGFNIGVVDWFEVDIGTGFELTDDDQEDRTLGSASDTELTFKILWWKGGEKAPSLATEVSLNIPTARKEFQPDEKRRVGGTGLVALTGETGALRYILDLGGGAEPNPKDADYVGVFLWALAAEVSIADGVALVSEFQGKVIPDADDEATALLGFTYTTPGGVKFDIAGFAGLSDGSDNWGITFGVTYTFSIFGR
jgi:hypothetical protein